MIHNLVVLPSMSVAETRKLARKLAMTGGYEVALPEELAAAECESLVESWSEELEQYPPDSAARGASIAGRLLLLLEQRSDLPESLREKLSQLHLSRD